jgi:hypothetical protein
MKQSVLVFVCLAVGMIGARPAGADDAAQAGRDILAKYQSAVVTVKLAIKQSMSMGGRESKNDSKVETTGTVVDPSGLTVVSLMTTDPGSVVKDAYARAMAARGGDPSQLKFESELSDVKIVLADGTEMAADVVLRDKDLDLAYVRPSSKATEAGTPARALPYVDLGHDAKAQVLDEVVVLNRLNQVANRVPAVSVGRIEAVVDKPRTFYVLGGAMWGYSLGAPVFAVDGRLVGILFLRTVKAQTDQNTGFMFNNLNPLGMMPIVLPASDLVDGVKQALEAKLPAAEEKPASEEKKASPGGQPSPAPAKE